MASSFSLSEKEDPGLVPSSSFPRHPPDPAVDERFINSLQAQGRGHALVAADTRCLLLHLAARTNRPAIASLLATQGSNLETTNAAGRTPLSVAAGSGHAAVVSALLDAGADVGVKGKHGRMPLWWAARNGHAEAVQTLLDARGIDCESPDASGRTVLAAAAANGHAGALKALLTEKSRVEINAEDPQGRTALSWAAGGGHADAVAVLLKMGADAEIQDVHGRTALHWAAAGGHQGAMAKLRSFGADVESADLDGRTALSWAAGNGHTAAVELALAEAGIDANAQDNRGRTPLSWAAEGGHRVVVKALIGWAKKQESDKERKLKRYKRSTPLEFALNIGAKKHVASTLVEYGLDVDLPDNEDRTPLSWAAGSGNKAVAATLIEHGAEVEAEDINDRTPLWWAAANGHGAMVEMLLEQDGVDPQRQDNNGETALSRAQYRGSADIVRLLGGAEADQPEAAGDTNYDGLLWWTVKEGHGAAAELLLRRCRSLLR
ncbi:hypothetical protein DL771_001614 [Monosporascus sp. 5C6A]|nr:hypothetical protein DL771_001614 [Monosporascus sp. 5C6A]